MRLGIGLGLFKAGLISAGVRIFSAFQTRVIGDGGTVEAGTCVVNGVNNSSILQRASFLLIPSGYKGGKLYAEIPTNGNGDLTWTRTSTAIRTNSSALLESMGTGVPRLSYMYGSCPSVLLEPQRTNLCLQSQDFANASWTKATVTLTANYSTSPDGSTNATRIVPTGGTALGYLNRVYRPIDLSSSTTYTMSVWAKSSASSPKMTLSIVNIAGQVFSITNTWQRYTLQFTGAGLASNFNIYAGDVSWATGVTNSTNEIEIYGAQLEAGAYPTTYIPTTSGATATRVADSFSRNNIYTNGLITSSGGTWFVELRGNVAYTRDAIGALWIGDNSTAASLGNSLNIRSAGTGLLPINKCVGGTLTQLYVTLTSTVKIAIKWNGTTADVFVNGTKVVSATSFSTTNMEFLNGQGNDVPKFIQQMALFPTPLSDTDCTTLTT